MFKRWRIPIQKWTFLFPTLVLAKSGSKDVSQTLALKLKLLATPKDYNDEDSL